MIKTFVSALFFVCSLSFLLAQQTIQGVITDAESQQPIPFVNIGIAKLATGTVSDEQGHYMLKVPAPDAMVTISAIGYTSQDKQASALLQDGNIALQPRRYAIPTIEVTASALSDENVILGRKHDKRGGSIGFGSNQLGTAIGALIQVKDKTLLKNANFTMNHDNGDSILFRVNIYEVQNGIIGENLLRENVIINAAQQKGTLTVDLSPYNLVVEHDVLLALEWIKDDQGAGNQGLSFRTKRAAFKSNIYLKIASIGSFSKLDAPLELCFYFVGKTVK